MAEGPRQARTRRRFARRQWARRWLTWRYILAVVLVLGAIGFTVYGVYFSPWLRVDGVQVVGTDRLSEDDVLAAAEVPTGGPLARADIDAIALRVRSLAAVKAVDVSRQWPHDVRIEVVERRPIAVVGGGDTLTYLDADGVTFGRLTKASPSLPRVQIGSEADRAALAEAAAVVAALSTEVSELVDHVEVETVDRIMLELRDKRVVRWGSAEQSEEKAAVLLELLAAVPRAQQYDVSVPASPTTK